MRVPVPCPTTSCASAAAASETLYGEVLKPALRKPVGGHSDLTESNRSPLSEVEGQHPAAVLDPLGMNGDGNRSSSRY
jgi:hypothetical protein